MSTKTNVRSPFFLDLTAPVQTLGTFTCTTAGLTNFSVASSGLVTNPQLLVGTIVGQDYTEFVVNTTGSSISRTVIYKISIPSGYTNVNDATIDCPQTFLQPTQASNENPSVNNNCPTFAGTIPNSTGSASTAIALSSGASPYFTSGSGANISSYEIIKSPSNAAVDAVLTGTAPSQTLTISSSIDCASASFIVKAKQSSDACTAISNSFTFASPNCGAYDCSDAILTGGSIEQDGTFNLAEIKGVGTYNAIVYDGTTYNPYSAINLGANTSGSNVDKQVIYKLNIPNGYSNSGVFTCAAITYSQTSSTQLPTFDCNAIQASGGFISEQGNIAPPTLGTGTLFSWTPQKFAEVSTNTPQTIYLTVTPPASNYSNSGGANITNCPYQITQPATFTNCFGTTFFISKASFIRPEDSCQSGMVWSTNVGVSSDINNFNTIISSIGNTVCFRLSPFRGGEKYYAVNSVTANSIAGTNTNYYLIKIDDYGVVQEVVQWNCSGGGSGSGGRIV
tara:strand:- start:648 stop:2168 length:1521 start_codon:yes stop_codon:yes gene_type:complete